MIDIIVYFSMGFIGVHLLVVLLSFIEWENAFRVLSYPFIFRFAVLMGTVASIFFAFLMESK